METLQAITRLLVWIVPIVYVFGAVYYERPEDLRAGKEPRPQWLRAIQATGAGLAAFVVWTFLIGNPGVLNSILGAISNGQR